MNNTIRLLIMVTANFILVAGMLYLLIKSGVDINNTTIADNTSDVVFTFDFIIFLVISFFVNIGIMVYPSKKRKTLKNIIAVLIEQESESRQVKRQRQRQRA